MSDAGSSPAPGSHELGLYDSDDEDAWVPPDKLKGAPKHKMDHNNIEK